MERFYRTGSFANGDDQGTPSASHKGDQAVNLPISMKRWREVGDAVCWFIPSWVGGILASGLGVGLSNHRS